MLRSLWYVLPLICAPQKILCLPLIRFSSKKFSVRSVSSLTWQQNHLPRPTSFFYCDKRNYFVLLDMLPLLWVSLPNSLAGAFLTFILFFKINRTILSHFNHYPVQWKYYWIHLNFYLFKDTVVEFCFFSH